MCVRIGVYYIGVPAVVFSAFARSTRLDVPLAHDLPHRLTCGLVPQVGLPSATTSWKAEIPESVEVWHFQEARLDCVHTSWWIDHDGMSSWIKIMEPIPAHSGTPRPSP